jgi:hypothetical protein
MGIGNFQLEPLEGRSLLSGVTLVTHGRTGSDEWEEPAWVDDMAGTIADRLATDTAVYELQITMEWNGQPYVASFKHLSGTLASLSSDAEVVVILDWAGAAGIGPGWFNRTDVIAGMVAPYFLGIAPSEGLTQPLSQLPIHLIGHSRGGSLVTELAEELGKQGLWIDQLTTLDPHPISLLRDDPEIFVRENVFFIDNYYETAEVLAYGEFVEGAANYDLTPQVPTHSGIHDFYQASIDNPDHGIGYDFARVGSSLRPHAGIGSNFLGDGTRFEVARVGTQWPNIGDIAILGGSDQFLVGNSINVDYFYQDFDSDMRVTWSFDRDQNPYNDNSQQIDENLHPSTGQQVAVGEASLPTSEMDEGNYYICAMVEDGDGHTRFAYADSPIQLVNAPPSIGSLSHSPDRVIRGNAITLTANNVNDANPQQALTVVFYYDANRNGALDSGDVEITRDQDPTDGWSISRLTTNLPAGLNQFFAVAWDGSKQSAAAKTSVLIAVPDAYEDNDLSAVVNTRVPGPSSPNLGALSSRKIISGLNTLDDDRDWYKFAMKATGTATNTIKINFTNSSGNIDLYLYRGSRLVRKSTTQRNVESVSLAGLAKGTYFILVYGYRGAANPNYKLTIDPPRASGAVRSRPIAAAKILLEAGGGQPAVGLLFNLRRGIFEELQGSDGQAMW